MEVTTVFPEHFTLIEVKKKLGILRKAASCQLAPNILQSSLKERYVKEEYINLKRPSYNLYEYERFNSEIVPILTKISSTEIPKVAIVQNYLEDITTEFYSLIRRYYKTTNTANYNFRKIEDYFLYIRMKLLNRAKKEEFLLVFSHGDFWEGNILNNSNMHYVIDWNTLDQRSCYFDFYFFMFSHASQTDKHLRINHLIKRLPSTYNLLHKELLKQSHLSSKHKSRLIDKTGIYLNLFYIEYIYLKTKEIIIDETDHIKEFNRWVELFQEYEQKIPNLEKQEYILKPEKYI
ncbi:hypothetical protein [Virgibacillus byunsanensis]